MSIESLDIVVKPEYDPTCEGWEPEQIEDWKRGVRDPYTVTVTAVLPDNETRNFTATTAPIANAEEETLPYVETLKQEAHEALVSEHVIGKDQTLTWPEPRILGK